MAAVSIIPEDDDFPCSSGTVNGELATLDHITAALEIKKYSLERALALHKGDTSKFPRQSVYRSADDLIHCLAPQFKSSIRECIYDVIPPYLRLPIVAGVDEIFTISYPTTGRVSDYVEAYVMALQRIVAEDVIGSVLEGPRSSDVREAIDERAPLVAFLFQEVFSLCKELRPFTRFVDHSYVYEADDVIPAYPPSPRENPLVQPTNSSTNEEATQATQPASVQKLDFDF
jgi:hypothetical protein